MRDENRTEVINRARNIIHYIEPAELGLRLNAIGTKDLLKDLLAVKSLNPRLPALHLFLPKIRSREDISNYVRLLAEFDIEKYELIPVIERMESFSNLETIINTKFYSLTKIAFGHCDFNLSKAIFPFIQQFDEEYWNWIQGIHDRLTHNIIFLNSPFLFLRDIDNFLGMLRRLRLLFGSQSGQITLSLKQLNYFRKFKDEDKPDGQMVNKRIKMNTADYAKWIISVYEGNRIAKRSFSVTDDRILISPQEYSAAKKYLSETT